VLLLLYYQPLALMSAPNTRPCVKPMHCTMTQTLMPVRASGPLVDCFRSIDSTPHLFVRQGPKDWCFDCRLDAEASIGVIGAAQETSPGFGIMEERVGPLLPENRPPGPGMRPKGKGGEANPRGGVPVAFINGQLSAAGCVLSAWRIKARISLPRRRHGGGGGRYCDMD